MKRKEKAGDLEFEISFYEGILEEDPDFLPALIPLADDYTRVGRYEEGLAMDEHLSSLKPGDPLVHYNLACSYALTDRKEKALAALNKAVSLGYDDLDWLEKDEDLEELRSTAGYAEIISALKSKKSPTQ
ncbi:MAG: tetratricopeptide repeat protein [Candidatus Tritonobacter lacicola]|nr:tetratricopeptide repeat protein [Candidatus Tritonobacter lacicola]